MKLVNKFNNCIGITLFRLFNFKVELWIVPANTNIPEHIHPHINSKLVPIFFGASRVSFTRNNSYSSRRIALSWPQSFLKFFNIKHTDYHYVNNESNMPLIFINLEHWLNHTKPSSAALDFQLRKELSNAY